MIHDGLVERNIEEHRNRKLAGWFSSFPHEILRVQQLLVLDMSMANSINE